MFMNNLYKMFLTVVAFTLAAFLYAEEAKDPDAKVADAKVAEVKPVINPKFLKLSVKKVSRTRKLKNDKALKLRTTPSGKDLNNDDKKDIVSLTVTINNKNHNDANNYSLVVEAYSKSVTERKPSPQLVKNFTVLIPKLIARKKYVKVFDQIELIYDKTEDAYEEPENEDEDETNTKKNRRRTTPAFGSCFYGYKVILLDSEKKEVQAIIWPSSFNKYLKKLKLQKEKENKK